MSEQVGLKAKTSENKGKNPVSAKPKENFYQSMDSPLEQVLSMQRTIGNQAVQRMIKNRTIQAKLKIGQPNDKYEQEADRVADKVMRMPEPKQSLGNGHRSLGIQGPPSIQREEQPEEEEEKNQEEEEQIQTKALADQITPLVQRQAEPEEEEPVQTKQDPNQTPAVTSNIESGINSLKGGGQTLSESIRTFFEPRFGSDFSQVRVHTDINAADIAGTINAKAFTTGKEVVFGAGEYLPGTTAGKNLLAHELTHVVQQGETHDHNRDNTVSPLSIKRETGLSMVNRWAEHEHKAFGDLAANMAMVHKNDFEVIMPNKEKITVPGVGEKENKNIPSFGELSEGFDQVTDELKKKLIKGIEVGEGGELKTAEEGVNIKHGEKGNTSSMGTGSMFAGDYSATPEELAQSVSLDPTKVGTSRYLVLAATNINHFFPLAAKEWEKLHAEARAEAKKAGTAYRKEGDKDKGDDLSNKAIQKEAFSLHFLQDSFASGHQYPRALEVVHSDWQLFVTKFVKTSIILLLEKEIPRLGLGINLYLDSIGATDEKILSGIKGLEKSKTYHDALCCLPKGLDTKNGGKFHGDYTADERDAPVAVESYNSLAQTLSDIAGIKSPAGNPKPNPGPDVDKIMEDPEARPIWYAMTHSIQELLDTAHANKEGTVKTDLGNEYKISDITTTAESLKKFDEKKLKKELEADEKVTTELIKAALSGRESKANNILLNFIKDADESFYKIDETGEAQKDNPLDEAPIFSFDTNADNEILKILSDENGDLDPGKVPGELTPNQVVTICQALISGVCGNDDEDAVLIILEAQKNDNTFLKAVNKLTTNYIDKGLDGKQWDLFLLICAHKTPPGNNLGARLIEKEKNDDAARMLINGEGSRSEVAIDNLSRKEWTGVIRALISGVCVDEDEQAILNLFRKQDNGDFKKTLTELSMDFIDKGIDGDGWDTFLLICADKTVGDNSFVARKIASEKNDDAARMIVGDWSKKNKMTNFKGEDWIDVIRALLSGRCGDEDEDAIVVIVRHMKNKGQAGLVNRDIGKDKMDSGVDGKQWKEVVEIMGDEEGFDWD